MVQTASTMLPLGTAAPGFSLPDATTGKQTSLADFAGRPLLVAFICNHCPYVKHIRSMFASVANEYQAKGVAFVGISSNDAVAYPDDAPAKMVEEAREAGYGFPYLFDDDQSVAKSYRAACTPDFFLFDAGHRLVYRGQFDATRPKTGATPTGADLRKALDAVLGGQSPLSEQLPSIGCNIKWKPGNAPEYFG